MFCCIIQSSRVDSQKVFKDKKEKTAKEPTVAMEEDGKVNCPRAVEEDGKINCPRA